MRILAFVKTLLILFGLSLFFNGTCQAQYRFQEYASLKDPRGFKLFVLEWGTKPDYNGKVAWRFRNNTNRTVYDVSIADRRYTLASGQEKGVSGQYMTWTLPAGESKTIYDYVNSSQNTGTWSNRNSNSVEYVALKAPNIRLKVNKSDPRRTSWSDYGTVSH
jgi:hypothetical protein